MKVMYQGTGAVTVEGIGTVAHGEIVDLPDALGKALTTENPSDWKPADAGKKKGGGD